MRKGVKKKKSQHNSRDSLFNFPCCFVALFDQRLSRAKGLFHWGVTGEN